MANRTPELVFGNNYLTYSAANDLGVLKIEKFTNLTEETLKNFHKNTTTNEILSTDYWFDKINKNVIDCARKSYAQEGRPVFFRGTTIALLRAFPLHGTIFVVYEQVMGILEGF